MDNGTYILTFNSTSYRVDQNNITSSNKLKREQSVYVIVNLTNTTSESVNYQAFGLSLTTSTSTEIVVLNDACKSMSSEAITSVSTS